MNAGLSNLATLKAWLLTEALVDGTDYDTQILAIGRGVAGLLESHCNRKFAREAEAVFEFSARNYQVIVDRYPIEAITKIEARGSIADGFIEQPDPNSIIFGLNEAAGMIDFGGRFGTERDRVRVTFRGGYWFNQQEADYEPPETPSEEDPDLSLLPEGAIALPDDLQLAWLLQCEHVWTQRDKLGTAIAEKPSQIYGGALAKIELLQVVREKLSPFIRYAML